MLVQFPFQKRKAAGPWGTPSKESTGLFGVSSDKEDDSVVTVSDDGSDPDGASTSTGRTVPTSRRKRSQEGGPSDAPPTKKPADRDETAPQQEQSLPAETMEAVLIATRNDLYGKDYAHVQEVWARLLGLDPDITPTDAQINASPRFALRLAAVERDAPDIVPITGCRTWRRTTGWLTAPQRSSTPLKAGCPYTPQRSWKNICRQLCQLSGRPSLPA